MQFCFTDGHGTWDSNFGSNYAISIRRLPQSRKKAEASKAAIAAGESPDEAYAEEEEEEEGEVAVKPRCEGTSK